jgi:hypothetical protein
VFVFVFVFVLGPKINFARLHQCARRGGQLTAHQPTKNQALLPSLFNLLVSSVQKKSLPGAGGVFLTRGEREVVAPAQGEETVCQEAGTGASRGRGGAMRGVATTSPGKRGDTKTRWWAKRQRTIKRANGRQRHVKRW